MEVSVLQQIAKTAWCMILNRPRGIALVYCPSICWRRCLAFLAQVWKKGGDLRQRSAREAISWRRSPAENHTCAMDRHHLRPEPPSPAPGITVTCAGNNHHFRHCCRNWSEQPTGNELVGVVLSLGAGIGSCWCRCLAFLVQVWKKGGDLRQRSAREAISRRRSRAENHTCAMDRHHLRPEPPSPAPATTVTCAANSYPRKPTRDSSTKSRVEGRTMRMSA